MTLDELQAEFPHGSRWTVPGEGPTVWRVVGWDPLQDSVLCRREAPKWRPQIFETRGLLPHAMRAAAAPCPITEPLTVYQRSDKLWQGWQPATRGPLPAVTLLPDGRYTWEGGPE